MDPESQEDRSTIALRNKMFAGTAPGLRRSLLSASACPVATSTADFRWLTEPQGRLILAPSVSRSVSQRCLSIHPNASRSEPNLPK
jgi:hypothetical protein